MTTSAGAAGIESDDFQSGSTLDSAWTFVAGQGGAGSGSYGWTGQGTSDAGITLTVPSTGDYEMWTSGFNGVLIHQACTNTDFTIEARFTDDAASDSTERGIFITNSGFTEVVTMGWYGANGFASWFVVGGGSSFADSGPTIVDRRIRIQWTSSGGAFVCQYYNGTGWTNYFSDTGFPAPAHVGIHCSNNATDNGDTADVDYFFEISAPVSPEDDTGGAPPTKMIIFT